MWQLSKKLLKKFKMKKEIGGKGRIREIGKKFEPSRLDIAQVFLKMGV